MAVVLAEQATPHDLGAELNVLGSLLIDSEAIHRVVPIVGDQTKSFFKTGNQLIYAAALRLMLRDDPIDLFTISEELKRAGDLERVGSVQDLYDMQESVPSAANVEYYARIVQEHATRRQLIDAGTEIFERARSIDVDLATVIEDAQRVVFGVHQRTARREFVDFPPVLNEAVEYIEELYTRKEETLGISTGIPDLDRLLSGLNKSDLIVVAARPSMGKSAFVHNIALNVARDRDVSVALITLEMGREQVLVRLLATTARVDMQKLRTGRLSTDEWRRITQAAGELEDFSIFINDTPGITIMEIRAECRRLKMRHSNLGLIVVDYLQLVQGGAHANQNREQEIAEYSRSLKELARELDVPVIALSQLNRAVESRPDKRPQLADLRESGAIEQDADIVMFLYRDDYYNPDTSQTPGQVELRVAKHRNGPTGNIVAGFEPSHLLFKPLDPVNVEYT